jgi:hypothetical protein
VDGSALKLPVHHPPAHFGTTSFHQGVNTDSMREPDDDPQKCIEGSIEVDCQAGKDRMPAGSSVSSSPTAQQFSQSPFSHDGDAQVYIPGNSRSIYSLYSTRRRNTILMAAAFTSIMVPFCDTIYLPALAVSCCCGGFCDMTAKCPYSRASYMAAGQLWGSPGGHCRECWLTVEF